MKKLYEENNIPTADFQICKNKNDVINFLKRSNFPVVLKADGLAAGEGVTICRNRRQVINISKEIFLGKFKSSKKLF